VASAIGIAVLVGAGVLGPLALAGTGSELSLAWVLYKRRSQSALTFEPQLLADGQAPDS
jgi:hypothetical protein